jgi:hypothetical protein
MKDNPYAGLSDTTKAIALIASIILGIFAVIWIIQGNDFFLYKVFAPQYEQARRETFEKSKAYNQGMIQELQNMQFEYIKATPEHKDALASIILHRAADYDLDKLPKDLREFIQKLKAERTGVEAKEEKKP